MTLKTGSIDYKPITKDNAGMEQERLCVKILIFILLKRHLVSYVSILENVKHYSRAFCSKQNMPGMTLSENDSVFTL